MMELFLDTEAFRSGVFYGMTFTLCAGGVGWLFRLMFKLLNSLTGV